MQPFRVSFSQPCVSLPKISNLSPSHRALVHDLHLKPSMVGSYIQPLYFLRASFCPHLNTISVALVLHNSPSFLTHHLLYQTLPCLHSSEKQASRFLLFPSPGPSIPNPSYLPKFMLSSFISSPPPSAFAFVLYNPSYPTLCFPSLILNH